MAPRRMKAARVGQHGRDDGGVFCMHLLVQTGANWVINAGGSLALLGLCSHCLCCRVGARLRHPTRSPQRPARAPGCCRQVVAGLSLVQHLAHQPCSLSPALGTMARLHSAKYWRAALLGVASRATPAVCNDAMAHLQPRSPWETFLTALGTSRAAGTRPQPCAGAGPANAG